MITFFPPGVLLGLLLSVLYAGVFHIWGGSSLRDLVIYLIAATVGFAVGQVIALLIELPVPHIGQVAVIEATVFSWLAMIGVRELGVGQEQRNYDNV